jgi:hypothetical protein
MTPEPPEYVRATIEELAAREFHEFFSLFA